VAELPNRIRELRKSQRWTLQQIADRVGCGTTHLSNMERGERTLTIYWMKRIAKVLRVQPADLLSREDNRSPLTSEQRELVNLWERGDERQRVQLLQMARIIVARNS
jgi:transcriptional regulator with XRE-family HTH domain